MNSPMKRQTGPWGKGIWSYATAKEKMADLYIGLSTLTGLSFIKVISLIQGTPLWLFASGIPLILHPLERHTDVAETL